LKARRIDLRDFAAWQRYDFMKNKGVGSLKERASVVIVAAGSGSRMNMPINKQFIEIGEIPVLTRTLSVFDSCENIDDIILVVSEEHISYAKTNIVEKYRIKKVKHIVAGGSDRGQSVYNGLKTISEKTKIVAIHDGARPFVSVDIIKSSIVDALKYGASCVAVKAKDTVKMSDCDGFITQTPNRDNLWMIQTPQTFDFCLLLKAYKKAIEDKFTGTDDSILVERIGHMVKLTPGSYDNIKITTQEDLSIGEAIAAKIKS
jgi:2-C-methyl-D-erythritol 4-phosphate cytidylyltransferase